MRCFRRAALERGRSSAPDFGREKQPLHDTPGFQVRVDDLVDVRFVHEGVPDRLRIDDRDRCPGAAVEAPGGVDANPAGAADAFFPDTLPAMIEGRLRALLRATTGAVGADVAAATHVAFAVAGT